MEQSIYLRCRECDVDLIKEVQAEAIAKYRELIVTEVKRFKGTNANDIPCKIQIDTKYLTSIEDSETGCIGGFKMYAKKGKIVCSQTIEDRIDLVFAEAIPSIRFMLFPSMRRGGK